MVPGWTKGSAVLAVVLFVVVSVFLFLFVVVVVHVSSRVAPVIIVLLFLCRDSLPFWFPF